MARVLVADDESNLRKVLRALLAKDGHETLSASDGIEALRLATQEEVDVAITDLRMPELDGMALLKQLRRVRPELPVIVITAHGSVETAVSALKHGAVDYITKPFDREELRNAVRKALGAGQVPQNSADQSLVGTSEAMQQVSMVIDRVAATPSTVLISGESGTGKELVAVELHERSDRKDKPLVKVNCAAIPRDLLESEFFGHEKGAFTGAVAEKPGRFELAHEGTLFLDEIGEIPIEMQVKLLRALQNGEFERVGGVKTLKVDARVIAATNRDLPHEIEAGNFREDLYYRLNVVPIKLPALRERPDDVATLTSAFLSKYAKRLGQAVKEVSPEALACLTNYRWPGNVRELENVIERTLLFAEGDRIELRDLPEQLTGEPAGMAAKPHAGVSSPPGQELPPGETSMKDIVRRATASLEKDLIRRALAQTDGNVTRAAQLLQISRKGLQNKMKEFGLRPDTIEGVG